MPQIKDSLYEQLYPLSTVAGQHLVEDFSGNTLDTFRWGARIKNVGAGVTVDGVIEMSNSIDGGLLILPIQELYDRGKLLRWFGISRERKNNQNTP